MSENKCPNGVNPEVYAKWLAEDREERINALHDLCTALWKVESLYEVESESDHPLEKAYELIYNFIDGEGLLDDLFQDKDRWGYIKPTPSDFLNLTGETLARYLQKYRHNSKNQPL